jgi:hypothetical protein
MVHIHTHTLKMHIHTHAHRYIHTHIDGERRWAAVEAIFRILNQDPEVRRMLSDPTVCKRTDPKSESEMARVQLIDGAHLDQVIPLLIQRLAERLVEDPPHRYRWLRRTCVDKRTLVNVMTDSRHSANAIFNSSAQGALTEHEQSDLLALRGLLARGILVHCLKKRFRVDYGLKTDAVKRMAVPYHASDTPSERSEFAQPDCAIMMTYLSYYYDGLTHEQVQYFVRIVVTCFS